MLRRAGACAAPRPDVLFALLRTPGGSRTRRGPPRWWPPNAARPSGDAELVRLLHTLHSRRTRLKSSSERPGSGTGEVSWTARRLSVSAVVPSREGAVSQLEIRSDSGVEAPLVRDASQNEDGAQGFPHLSRRSKSRTRRRHGRTGAILTNGLRGVENAAPRVAGEGGSYCYIGQPSPALTGEASRSIPGKGPPALAVTREAEPKLNEERDGSRS